MRDTTPIDWGIRDCSEARNCLLTSRETKEYSGEEDPNAGNDGDDDAADGEIFEGKNYAMECEGDDVEQDAGPCRRRRGRQRANSSPRLAPRIEEEPPKPPSPFVVDAPVVHNATW